MATLILSCPHCSADLEMTDETRQALLGSETFECPVCHGAIPGSLLADPEPPPPRRTRLLIIAATVILVGIAVMLGVSLTQQPPPVTQMEDQTDRRQLHLENVRNQYYEQVLARGVDETAMAAVREVVPMGLDFVGVSTEPMTWKDAQLQAEKLNAIIMVVEKPGDASRIPTLWRLAERFPALRNQPIWVSEKGMARLILGSELNITTALETPRYVYFQWLGQNGRN